MVLSAFLQGNDKTTIEKAKVLYITKKTVRFGDDVYQFRNVTGFGIGEVKPKKIPFIVILGLFLLGIIMISFNSFVGSIMLLCSIAALATNLSQPKLYGLELYLNSGDGKIFITRDIPFLKRTVGELYDFMESNKEETYTVTITDSTLLNSPVGDKNNIY